MDNKERHKHIGFLQKLKAPRKGFKYPVLMDAEGNLEIAIPGQKRKSFSADIVAPSSWRAFLVDGLSEETAKYAKSALGKLCKKY
ncbi:hypothetical protein HFQ13_10465 [Acidithiobacillus sp. VAN18-1]|uniref:Uncharacterized protein n=1 Tax=Igneacidithiobacillus copahuensis TaxID=2724909 RepID=A0AAE3CK87_9PROT|nr:hypothetical protein [Igneacidithiobacillus copahuensis]MBU2788613.1 hypothetical protein [Igneacidithiobacillus copahuensis]MBU2796703.1 hypothetical protein [Acidithiobacillus sp. VAN18-2]